MAGAALREGRRTWAKHPDTPAPTTHTHRPPTSAPGSCRRTRACIGDPRAPPLGPQTRDSLERLRPVHKRPEVLRGQPRAQGPEHPALGVPRAAEFSGAAHSANRNGATLAFQTNVSHLPNSALPGSCGSVILSQTSAARLLGDLFMQTPR